MSITAAAPASSVRAITISAMPGPSFASITTDAPRVSRASVLCGEVVTAITCPPRMAAICTAWEPRPPPAPMTTTVSPSETPAAVTAFRATPAGHASNTAWLAGMPSGTGTTAVAGSTTYSAKPPSRPCPMPFPTRHRCSLPATQRAHRPQAAVSRLTTRSPGLGPVTPSPGSTTVPAISCPRITSSPTPRRSVPFITSRSWWQKPQASTRSRTSPRPGLGTGRRVMASSGGRPGLTRVNADMVSGVTDGEADITGASQHVGLW